MAVLTSCWFIIETVIIPDGFIRKWFCLSFFIHPLFLFFCQIFLWLKLLKDCLLVVLVFPFRVAYVLCLYIFIPLRKCVLRFCSFIRQDKAEFQEEAEQYFEAQPTFNLNQITNPYVLSSTAFIRCKVKLLELEEDVFEEGIDHREDNSLLCEDENVDKAKFYLCDPTGKNEDLFCDNNSFTTDESSDECLHHVQGDCVEGSIPYENMEEPMFYGGKDTVTNEFLLCNSNSFVTDQYSNVKIPPLCASETPDRDDRYMDEYPYTAYSSNFQPVQGEAIRVEAEEELDEFYKVYTERMRWFDLLNYERTCGISAVENKQIGTPSPLKSIEYPDSGILRISWSKMTTRRLLRSLENDFEMVYVAQSCLSWKALHHQYTKVKALEFSSSQNSAFCSYVAGEFQKFQILLERFMENEQSGGKRVGNYVRGRFSLKGLLQVPEVSVKGIMEEDKENMKGEGTNIIGVLKVIEECIEAFWLFVKTDNSKKSWWKIKTSSWTYPPVEDPRDLELLADLTKRLQKNKLWLKDLEGKKRCLLKRIVNPLEDSQRKEMLFTMIDMKLVSRVLQMSMTSSAQLKWCQKKLDNVELKDGKVFRACTDPLFPL